MARARVILIERVVAAALQRLAGDGWLAASCAWRRVGSPLLFSLGPALEAGEGRHGHGEHNSSIQLHRHRHGHEIDTLSSRYKTGTSTLAELVQSPPPRHSIRPRPFAGKGKERGARAIMSSQVQPTNRPLRTRRPADRRERVGLACAVRAAWSGLPLFPR